MAGGAVRPGGRWRVGAGISRHSRPPSRRRKHIHSASSLRFLQMRDSPPTTVAPNSPRRRRPSNACGRGGDGHCPASASPASTANSHSERLHATAHSGVYSYIPGDVNDGADRSLCRNAHRHSRRPRLPASLLARCRRHPRHARPSVSAPNRARRFRTRPRPETTINAAATGRPSLADGLRRAGWQEPHSISLAPTGRSR